MNLSVVEAAPVARPFFTSGGREVVKWFALVLMLADHVDKALGWEVAGSYELSRAVFPLFAAVLAFGAAQESVRYAAMVRRLFSFAVVAQPFYMLAFGSPWSSLNVLFTLGAGVAVCWALSSRNWPVALAVFGFFMPWVDYGWAGIAVVVACWWWFRGGRLGMVLVVGAFTGVCLYNGNTWAALALPAWQVLGRFPLDVIRGKWTFYAFYVGHLAVLAALVMWGVGA